MEINLMVDETARISSIGDPDGPSYFYYEVPVKDFTSPIQSR